MKTFQTTIYNLRWRHLLHFLGIALGLLLIIGFTNMLIITGANLIESKSYRVLISFSLMVPFGLSLLIPKKIIVKRKSTRMAFYIASGLFSLQIGSSIFTGMDDENGLIYNVIVIPLVLIAIGQIQLVRMEANQSRYGQ